MTSWRTPSDINTSKDESWEFAACQDPHAVHALRMCIARDEIINSLCSALPPCFARNQFGLSHEKFYVWPRPKKLRPLSDEFEMHQHDKFYFVVQKIMLKKKKNYVERETVMNLSKLTTVLFSSF